MSIEKDIKRIDYTVDKLNEHLWDIHTDKLLEIVNGYKLIINKLTEKRECNVIADRECNGDNCALTNELK